jgi:hypothetical protein
MFVELGIRADSSALFGQTAAEISHLGPNNSPTTVWLSEPFWSGEQQTDC